MANVYFAPFEIEGQAKTGGADYTSPEINIPYNVDKWSVHILSDQAGTLLVQEDFNGTYTTIDSTPVIASSPAIVNYAMRVPKIKFVFQSAVTGTFTAYVRINYNSEY